MPILSKVAKKVLTIPASSAKSEKVFSTGGNFVTKKKKYGITPKKVEELIIIKENNEQLEDFKENGGYEITQNQINPFKAITVDQIIQEIFNEENMESEDEEGYEDDEDEDEDDEEDEGDFEDQLDENTEDEDSSEED